MNSSDLFNKAVRQKRLDVVKFFIENGTDIHADEDYAIRIACYDNNLDMLKYLVEKGADIHIRGDWCLMYASYNGYLEVVKYLVEHGADIHTGTDYALRFAKTQEIKDYLQNIINNKNKSKIQEKIETLKKELSELQKLAQ